MTVLVAYASKHGATRAIAERIAVTLTATGQPAVARPAEPTEDLAGYDAFVVGGAAYYGHWLRAATTFVLLPEGDFRDWAEIDAWAGSIPTELAAGQPAEDDRGGHVPG